MAGESTILKHQNSWRWRKTTQLKFIRNKLGAVELLPGKQDCTTAADFIVENITSLSHTRCIADLMVLHCLHWSKSIPLLIFCRNYSNLPGKVKSALVELKLKGTLRRG